MSGVTRVLENKELPDAGQEPAWVLKGRGGVSADADLQFH